MCISWTVNCLVSLMYSVTMKLIWNELKLMSAFCTVRDHVVCLTLCFSLFAWSNWEFSQLCFRIAALWVKTPSWFAEDPAFGRNMVPSLSRYNSEDGGSMFLWNVYLHLPDHTLNVRRPENLISECPHTQGTWHLTWIALACFAQQTLQLCIIIVTSRWKRLHDNY